MLGTNRAWNTVSRVNLVPETRILEENTDGVGALWTQIKYVESETSKEAVLLQITPIVSEYPVSVLQKLNTASVSNAENSTKKISWLLSLTDRQDKQAYWQWGQELMIYEKQVSESNVFQNLPIHS